MSVLVHGYATGVFSSRKIEMATYDSVAFRYLACNRHPDHDTLATFRRRFGATFQAIFVQVLEIAQANRVSRFGTVSLDGTKIQANASRHSALSHGHAETIEGQLKSEVQALLDLAEQADQSALPDGLSVPDTLLADAGYFSERNVEACLEAGITPLIAPGRESHHPDWSARFKDPDPLPEGAGPVERMNTP